MSNIGKTSRIDARERSTGILCNISSTAAITSALCVHVGVRACEHSSPRLSSHREAPVSNSGQGKGNCASKPLKRVSGVALNVKSERQTSARVALPC